MLSVRKLSAVKRRRCSFCSFKCKKELVCTKQMPLESEVFSLLHVRDRGARLGVHLHDVL